MWKISYKRSSELSKILKSNFVGVQNRIYNQNHVFESRDILAKDCILGPVLLRMRSIVDQKVNLSFWCKNIVTTTPEHTRV